MKKETLLQKCSSTVKNDHIVSNVPPFIKDELNTELFRNRFTNEESESPLLKHVALS